MRSLFLSAAVAIAATAASSPAGAGLVTIGNSTARDCYEAAVARSADRNSFNHCDIALDQEALSRKEIGRAHV